MKLTPQIEEQINYICPNCSVHRHKKSNICVGCGKNIKQWDFELRKKTLMEHIKRFFMI